ncbi:unnamed protein product [Sphagnum balticum]
MRIDLVNIFQITHERQFPDHVEYRTDPLSLKLEKSSTLDNAKVFTPEDLKLHLDNEDIFVKHFPFDIK